MHEVMVGLREEGLTDVAGLVILFQRKTLHVPVFPFIDFFLTTYTLQSAWMKTVQFFTPISGFGLKTRGKK